MPKVRKPQAGETMIPPQLLDNQYVVRNNRKNLAFFQNMRDGFFRLKSAVTLGEARRCFVGRRKSSDGTPDPLLSPGRGVVREDNPQAGDDMELRNSVLDFDLVSRLRSSSIASTVERGLSTLRSTQTRLNSSGGRSSSSLRVPER